jgi:Glyoxalase-like domain
VTPRLDHLVHGALDLDAAVDDLHRRLGVRAGAGGRHPGLGTHNALLSLGERSYLEIIAPDPTQPAPARRPFSLDSLVDAHLAAWAVACDDIDAAVARARQRGYDPGDAVQIERATPDGSLLRWRLTTGEFAGGPIPFLIEWGDTPHPAPTAPQGLRLTALHVEHPDPASIAPALAAIDVDVEVRTAAAFAIVATVSGPNGTVELR